MQCVNGCKRDKWQKLLPRLKVATFLFATWGLRCLKLLVSKAKIEIYQVELVLFLSG